MIFIGAIVIAGMTIAVYHTSDGFKVFHNGMEYIGESVESVVFQCVNAEREEA
jgi:hypothetical protein